jgi:hypothetical protein
LSGMRAQEEEPSSEETRMKYACGSTGRAGGAGVSGGVRGISEGIGEYRGSGGGGGGGGSGGGGVEELLIPGGCRRRAAPSNEAERNTPS